MTMRKQLANYVLENRDAYVALTFSLAILLVVALWAPRIQDGDNDFLSFYAAAKLVEDDQIYSLGHVFAIQEDVANAVGVHAYIRPPYYAGMLWPFGRLSYRTALLLWQLINVAALGGFVWIWHKSPYAAVLSFWFFPTWINFGAGQDVALILLWFAISYCLIRKKMDFAAGLVMSLCGAKFHLFLLLPILILARGMWRFGLGVLSGGVCLLAISFGLAGRSWPQEYFDLVWLNDRLSASQEKMLSMAGFFHGMPCSLCLMIGVALVVACALWFVCRSSDIRFSLAATLCGGLIISPHAYLYDGVMLLPALICLLPLLGTGTTLAVAMGVGLCTLALPVSYLAFVGQLAVIGFYFLTVYTGLRLSASAVN